MGMVGMANTQDMIQSLSQLSWTIHGNLEEIIRVIVVIMKARIDEL